MDNLTQKERSRIMSLVKSRDTVPERTVRKIITELGYRYRLHRTDLPGKPDIVFPSRQKIVFVHGCYWHGHKCSLGRIPKSRVDFWMNKIAGNRTRDLKNRRKLGKLGWETLAVWECQLSNTDSVAKRLRKFLK
jgi:DNA mismatch endonuclease (patch repair protein)